MASYQSRNLFDYTPDLGFNISGTVLFGVIFGAFAFWFAKYPRTRWIQALACLTAVSEMVVYALRSASNTEAYAESVWVAQYILGLFSPMWLLIGMLLALNKSYESNSAGAAAVFNRPKLFTMFLIGYQATVGLIILVGACFVGINRTVPGAYDYANNSGIYVLLTGLGNQVGVLTLVQGLLVWTLIRLRRDHRTGSSASDSSRFTAETSIKTFKIFIERLFLTFGMLWVRAIFRLCEQASPFNTIPQNSECYYALFDWAQVLVASLVWAVWPFAKGCDVDVGQDRERSIDGVARVGAGKGDRFSMDSGSRLTV